MHRLMLLRHAKSSWDDPGQADRDRPLNARGCEAAAAIGRYIAANGLVPDLVLCSPALRTRQTWLLACKGRKTLESAHITFEGGLYERDGEDILRVMREVQGEPSQLLIVGHNPGLEELADILVASGEARALERLDRKFPTGALAVIALDISDWAKAEPGTGRLERFVTPKTLDAANA